MELKTVAGFKRAHGKFGIRNHLIIVATVFCANRVVNGIADALEGAIPITHQAGCGQLGADAETTRMILLNTGLHPNVGAVLYVGLGCEQHAASDLAAEVAQSGKVAAALDIQKCGGTPGSIARGLDMCKKMGNKLMQTETCAPAVEELIFALECGGSDFTSGMASNPALGEFTDLVLELGATVVFGETCDLMGVESVICRRAKNNEVKQFILDRITFIEKQAIDFQVELKGSQPSPGNICGGLSVIEDKSLGAGCKSGTKSISGTLNYAELVKQKGLLFMDCPGQDLTSLCGLISAGAHMALFTTGRGTPLGYAIAPVIKITANAQAATSMAANIDLDLSGLLSGQITLSQAGDLILQRVKAVAGGYLCCAERLGHREFGFYTTGPTL